MTTITDMMMSTMTLTTMTITTKTTMRTTMMMTTKTSKMTMDNNAIMFSLHYNEHMCCTRSKLTKIPHCEPITSLL
jgi:hypothetical protein